MGAVGQPIGQSSSKARHFNGTQVWTAAWLQVWPASVQVESLSQHIKCSAHYLLRVLAKLPIKIWIVVCVPTALEDFGIDRPIKKPRRDTQRSNLIAGRPCGTDLIGLENHVAAHDVEHDMGCSETWREIRGGEIPGDLTFALSTVEFRVRTNPRERRKQQSTQSGRRPYLCRPYGGRQGCVWAQWLEQGPLTSDDPPRATTARRFRTCTHKSPRIGSSYSG